MQHFVLLLSDRESLLVRLVVLELSGDVVPFICGSYSLIFNSYAVEFALIDETLVLVVPDLALGTGFKLFPGFLLNHGSIGVHVLPLKRDLLELLCKPVIFILLILLLLLDLLIGFHKSLLSNGFPLVLKSLSSILLSLSLSIVFLLPLVASFHNLSSSILELVISLILTSQIILPLLLCFLLKLPSIEFNSLPKFCYAHFL